MIWLILLLGTYGMCFGFQHKLEFLHKRWKWLDELLACSYCMGFHAGWLVFFLHSIGTEFHWGMLAPGVIFAFAAAGFCYFMDCLTAYLENL